MKDKETSEVVEEPPPSVNAGIIKIFLGWLINILVGDCRPSLHYSKKCLLGGAIYNPINLPFDVHSR